MRNATVNQPPTRADSSMTENLAAGQEMLHERGTDLYAYYLRSHWPAYSPCTRMGIERCRRCRSALETGKDTAQRSLGQPRYAGT